MNEENIANFQRSPFLLLFFSFFKHVINFNWSKRTREYFNFILSRGPSTYSCELDVKL